EITYTSIADTILNLMDNVGGYVTGDVDVMVIGGASAAQLAQVDALTTGAFTYTHVIGSADHLVANAGGYITGSVDVTFIAPQGATPPSIAQIAAVVGMTTGDVFYTVIRDTAANIIANTGGYVTG